MPGDGIRKYRNFGTVCIYDTTYGVGATQLPVTLLMVADYEGNLHFVAMAITSNEKTEDHAWFFQNLVIASSANGTQPGMIPNVILTDQAKAIKAAVELELKGCLHLLCSFHVYKNLDDYISKCKDAGPIQMFWEDFFLRSTASKCGNVFCWS